MTEKKEQTKAGAIELREVDLDKVQGGVDLTSQSVERAGNPDLKPGIVVQVVVNNDDP